jgi:glycosyltransferase involved in cell wall biosynthesis
VNSSPPAVSPWRPKVGFLSLDDAAQPNLLSGGFFGMRQGFKEIGCEVVDIFPLRPVVRPFWLAKKLLYRSLGRYYHWDREPDFLRLVGRMAEARVRQVKPDFVIAVQSPACAELEVGVPVVLTHDQTFLERLAYVPFERRPPAEEYVQQALEQEGRSFRTADLIAYPSRRSCDTVQEAYGISGAKLRLVPWGGNLPEVPSAAEVDRMIQARGHEPIVLTAIGVHWERKGGDVIVAAYRSLRRSGVKVRLNVIGMTPPTKVDEGIHFLPFVDKSTPAGFRKIADLLAATHVLVAPSRVEAFGHVFAEAAAFGVPAVAADVGGVSTSIDDGVNGRLLPPNAPGEDYARAVQQLFASPLAYLQAAHASRARFERDLNWPAFCRTIADEVAALGAAPLESPHEKPDLLSRQG